MSESNVRSLKSACFQHLLNSHKDIVTWIKKMRTQSSVARENYYWYFLEAEINWNEAKLCQFDSRLPISHRH